MNAASPVSQPLLHIRGVTKKFGSLVALDRVDLKIHRGDFIAIFGPNGAGKTTLLKVIASLLQPSSGAVLFLDDGTPLDRRHVGYVSHQSLLYNEMSGLENLRFYARLYDLRDGENRIREMIRTIGLDHAKDLMVRGYSRGMKQRLTLARALLHDPELLLLDEPYTGLDQHGNRLLSRILGRLAEESRTVLLITHNLREGLEISNRLVIQNRGRIVFQARRDEVDEACFEQTYLEMVERN